MISTECHLEPKFPSRREAISLMGLLAAGFPSRLSAGAPVRLVVSDKLVTGISINDARAAMLIWIKRVAADTGLGIDFPPQLFETTADIIMRLKQSTVDAVAITAPEFREMEEFLDQSQVVIQRDSANRQYVIAVKKGRADSLAGLRNGRLLTFQGPSTCLSRPWLVSQLAREKLGAPESFFSSIVSSTKASQVILPVFFGHADGCLTTARSVQTMAELNPQVSKQLDLIATSPPFTPSFYIFRKNYHSAEREKMMAAMTAVLSNPAGRQIMTMFQFDALMVKPGDVIKESISILEAAEKARGRARS